LTCIII